METERENLLKQDENLHVEADRMLAETGIGALLRQYGYHAVGSYVMRTMTWRDLDFERAEDPPDWRRHWEFGMRLAELGLIWKFSCVDSYRDRRVAAPENGLYWGIQFDYPKSGPVWKMDFWTARQVEWDIGEPRRALWTNKLTDESRLRILEIKNAVWRRPEYRSTMLSVHIYEAVLERGIYDVEPFLDWWKAKYAEKD